MVFLWPIAKDSDLEIKMKQKFVFLFLLTFAIYMSGFDLLSLSSSLQNPYDRQLGHFELRNSLTELYQVVSFVCHKTYSYF